MRYWWMYRDSTTRRPHLTHMGNARMRTRVNKEVLSVGYNARMRVNSIES